MSTARRLQISRAQKMGTLAGSTVNSRGCIQDAVNIQVKGVQHACFVLTVGRFKTVNCIGFEEKGYLHRPIVAKESNTVV